MAEQDKSVAPTGEAANPETHATQGHVGAPGGPYSCTPSLNGRQLVDDFWNLRLHFVSDTCEQVAQTMADGGGMLRPDAINLD